MTPDKIPSSFSRRLSWKPPAIAAAAVFICHALVLALSGNQNLRMPVSDLLIPLESTAAATLLVLVAFRARAEGERAFAAWLMLAISYLFVAGSDIQWSVVEIFGGTAPFPSAGDIVYLLSYPTFFVGTYLLSPPSAQRRERVRRLLDIGIIILSSMLVLWVFLLSPVLAWVPNASWLLKAIGMLYLIGDVALVSALMVLVFGRASTVYAGSRWFLMGSIFSRMVADCLFSFQTLGGVTTNGHASDIAYAASSLTAFFAALLQMSMPAGSRPQTVKATDGTRLRDRVDWLTHLPFVGIFFVFFILIWSRAHRLPMSDVALAVWAGAVVVLSILRQALQGIENTRLNRDLDRRVRERTVKLSEANLELYLLDQVRTALARELHLSIVLRTIVETVAETLGYSMVSLYLRDKDALVLQYEIGYERVIDRIPLTQGVLGRAARNGKPVVVGDAAREPDFLAATEGIKSEIAVPLLDHGVVEGVLSVESIRGEAFGEPDLRLLMLVADHAIIAIVRARLFSLVRESEERYRRLIETSPNAIILTDAALGILIANQMAAELYGYDHPAQFMNQYVTDLVKGEDRGLLDAAIIGVLDAGAVSTVEFRVLRRDGREIPVEASASAVTGPDGKLAGVLIVARDISERKRIEAELRDYQEELERRVDERTSALRESQERLRQAEKMEAIRRLAGGVAHDFNNMLMVIMGHGQLLMEAKDLSVERRKEVAAVLESAERAASLTHQLLTFSRQGGAEIQALDLNAVLDGMADMVSRLVGQHVRLEIRPGSDLWSVLCDRVQMEQVVLNLAANAADAMKSGGVIEIQTSNVTVAEPLPLPLELVPPGRYVLLMVRDSGEGIPAEAREHVFEPFFTTKEKGKGTGLGLATVYGAVKQAKGFIGLESASGLGTTFRIYLPAGKDARVEDQESRAARQIPGGTESILVVDDQDEVRTVTVLMLRNLGYTVYEAGSGKEGLALLGKLSRRPDLVISDVSMPDMTGPAFLRNVAGPGVGPRTIFMSGYARDAFERNETGVAGGTGAAGATFLQKPFSALDLALVVRRVLDGPHPGGNTA